MSKEGQFLVKSWCLSVVLATGFAGCASVGTPGGGLYDETPPVLRNSEPSEGATHVRKQKITMHFDENIKLDNAQEKMTVSPPQQKAPIIMSNAKTLTIELGDSLLPNTTYSIDLGNAVQDNNESNPLDQLSLLFSTGDHIDSLQMSGYLLNASNLEPVTGAFVGIYRDEGNLNDSVLLNKSFERAGKTDSYGHFKILGCAPGQYRMYALVDGNTNYRYDLTSENIAFCDSLITPSMDSMAVQLFAFNEGKLNRYLDDCKRPDSVHINIRFATPMDSVPELTFLEADGTTLSGDSLLIPELNPTLDTLSYWIKDSLYYQRDTLNLALSYYATDTAGTDVVRTDTIQLLNPVQRASAKSQPKEEKKSGKKRKGKKGEAEKDSVPPVQITYMQIKQLSGQSLNIGDKPRFEVSAPLDSLHLDRMHLQYQKDTTWMDMRFRWVPDSLHPRRFTLLAEPHFDPGTAYRLTVDSCAMRDIIGNPVNTTVLKFKEKSTEEYAHLLINIEGVNEPAYVELLDSKDRVVQKTVVVNNQARFVHVAAGTYYARIVIDTNQNGKFDAGDLFKRRQPERVYYLNAELQLRANWTIQQTWNPTEVPVLNQKPEAVKQNKPKEKREKKSKNEEYLKKMGKK